MPRGRPTKPVEAKRRTGNPGKRKLPEPLDALPATTDAPKAPAGLQAPGKRLWTDVWAAARAWLTPALDTGTVELACRALDEVAAHRRDIAERGRLIEEPVLYHGEVVFGVCRLKPNPALKSLRAAEAQLERWLSALALTPTERARLGLAQVKAQSKLEKLIEARAQRDTDRARGQPGS